MLCLSRPAHMLAGCLNPSIPTVGQAVLHLFLRTPARHADREAVAAAVKEAEADGVQVVPVAMLGHKADLGFMALGPGLVALRPCRPPCIAAGLDLVDSYLSLTEISEYAKGMPAEHAAGPPLPAAAARGQAGLLLLPHVQAAGREPQLVRRCPTTSARR